jgi:hypothetical protein
MEKGEEERKDDRPAIGEMRSDFELARSIETVTIGRELQF